MEKYIKKIGNVFNEVRRIEKHLGIENKLSFIDEVGTGGVVFVNDIERKIVFEYRDYQEVKDAADAFCSETRMQAIMTFPALRGVVTL